MNPNNILVDSNFHPKLSKIGFYIQPQNSQSVFGRSSSNLTDISLLYLAPEILESQQNILKSDVYSFALIFFEILSNEAPFKKTNDYFQLMQKIVNEKYRPSFEKTGINEETQKLIEKCWSDNPSDRPSFFKILDELETNEKVLASNVDKQKYKNSIKPFNIYSCLLDRQE